MNAFAEQTVTVDQAPERRLVALTASPEPYWAPVVIRLATEADGRSLERLAQLDSAPPPEGRTIIGELRGRAVAAVSLSDGRTIADPFVLSQEIVELVQIRARQLRERGRGLWAADRAR